MLYYIFGLRGQIQRKPFISAIVALYVLNTYLLPLLPLFLDGLMISPEQYFPGLYAHPLSAFVASYAVPLYINMVLGAMRFRDMGIRPYWVFLPFMVLLIINFIVYAFIEIGGIKTGRADWIYLLNFFVSLYAFVATHLALIAWQMYAPSKPLDNFRLATKHM